MANPWKVSSWINQYKAATYRRSDYANLLKAVRANKKAESKLPQSRRITEDGRLYDVDSTAIENIEYDPNSQTATVKFHNGDKLYDYRVSPEEFKEFLDAGSKGSHVACLWNHNPHFHA